MPKSVPQGGLEATSNRVISSTLRILAYIDEIDQPPLGIPTRGFQHSERIRGFVLDVTVLVEFETESVCNTRIFEHRGDGVIYSSLDEAELEVVKTTGIDVVRLPPEQMDPNKDGSGRCVAFLERDFLISGEHIRPRPEDGLMYGRDPVHKSFRRKGESQ